MNNTIIKAIRKAVKFSDSVSVEGFMLPDGSFRVGKASASIALGFQKNYLGELRKKSPNQLEGLFNEGYTGKSILVQVDIDRGATRSETMSLDDFKILVNFYARQGNQYALGILGIEQRNKKKQSTKKQESLVRDRLALKLSNAQTEVLCLAGRIDILSDDEIIEVKIVSDWKNAIGQILVYSDYYPEKIKRIHLFGNCDTDYKDIILRHTNKLGILVTFENYQPLYYQTR